jgi:anti-sigma regulatory factor (Ser/Thr protein kinase)
MVGHEGTRREWLDMGTKAPTASGQPARSLLPTLDAGTLAGSATCALPGLPEAVASARDFTRATLRRWNLDGRYEDVALVVSELVTNALRHGLAAAVAPVDGRPVRLHLMRWSARLVCAVRDPGRRPPRTVRRDGEAESVAESGRGLLLVESFADGWGWQPVPARTPGEPEVPGKVVWALFRLTSG